MTHVTGNLGTATSDFGTGTARNLVWGSNSADEPLRIDIPSALTDGGTNSPGTQLRRVGLTNQIFTIRFSSTTRGTNQGGPDLSDAWEGFDQAIVIRAGDASLVLPGPANAAWGGSPDSQEPYLRFLSPAPDLRTRVNAFLTAWGTLTTAERNAATITLQDALPATRIAGNLPIEGIGRSILTVQQPAVRFAGTLPVEGIGRSALDVAQPTPLRIAGNLPIEGVGRSALDVAQPALRFSGDLPIEGIGRSTLTVVQPPLRISGRLPVEGIGRSNLTVRNPGPVRIAGRLPVEGVGRSILDVLQPPLRISGRLPVEGIGRSILDVRNADPVRIAGRLVIEGLGRSGLDVDQPPAGWDVTIRASAPESTILTALEIEHPDAAAPLRVIDATENRTIEGNTYVAIRFDARLAYDDDNRPPQAELAMDNVGREATRWIEAAGGGAGATVRIMQLLDTPGAGIEWEMTMDVTRLYESSQRIVARLGFDTGIGRPAVAMRHDPQTTPGIF